MCERVLLLWWGNVNKKDHLEDLDVERRIIGEMDKEVKCMGEFWCLVGKYE